MVEIDATGKKGGRNCILALCFSLAMMTLVLLCQGFVVLDANSYGSMSTQPVSAELRCSVFIDTNEREINLLGILRMISDRPPYDISIKYREDNMKRQSLYIQSIEFRMNGNDVWRILERNYDAEVQFESVNSIFYGPNGLETNRHNEASLEFLGVVEECDKIDLKIVTNLILQNGERLPVTNEFTFNRERYRETGLGVFGDSP